MVQGNWERISESDRRLSITYTPTMVGILGAVVLGLGVVLLVVGMLKPRRVAVRCEDALCVVQKLAVLRTTTIEVPNIRGAIAEEKRRGARDNVRLVLRGETDVEAAGWTSRGDADARAYRDIAAKIEAHVAAGSKGTVEASVASSQTIVLWLLAVTLLGIGGVMIGIYFTGSKVKVDGPRGEHLHRGGRGELSELASVEVRGPSLVAIKKSGSEVRLLAHPRSQGQGVAPARGSGRAHPRLPRLIRGLSRGAHPRDQARQPRA